MLASTARRELPSPMSDEDLIGYKEVGRILGIPKRSVYELPIPRHNLSTRRTRWARADVQEFKEQCRSIGQQKKAGGDSDTVVGLVANVTRLRSSFRRAGASGKPKPTIGNSAVVYSLKPQG